MITPVMREPSRISVTLPHLPAKTSGSSSRSVALPLYIIPHEAGIVRFLRREPDL